MNRFIQYKKVLGIALAALTFVACTDKWDEHYDDSPLAGANEGTLWQAITQHGDLNNFARVAQACGYDKSLKSSQVFTVFAPTDASFSSAQADSVIALYQSEINNGVRLAENRAIKEFLQNHIARYTYSVSPTTEDSIVMMNGKYEVLTASRFSGTPVLTSNKLYENGVLFTIGQPVKFYNNVFEYLFPGTDNDLDSVSALLYDSLYYRYYLDEEKSVAGDLVDGKTSYLDSVMTKYNELFYTLGQLNSEDSTYWMVVPTNSEWDRLITEYKPFFNYHDQVDLRDSLMRIRPRMAIMRGTVFSMTVNPAVARHLEDASVKADSVRSTNAVTYNRRKSYWGSDTLHYYEYMKPFANGGVFDGAQYVKCSNGYVLKTNHWNISPRETFIRDIVVEAENANYTIDEETTKKNTVAVRVQQDNPFYGKVSNDRYLEVLSRNSLNPIINFEVPDVLSGVPYDIYLITVPAEAGDTLADEEQCRPIRFQMYYFWKEQDGSGIDVTKLKSTETPDAKYSLGSYDGYIKDGATAADSAKAHGRAHVVDTILVGEKVIFPTCSYGLDQAQVQIRVKNNMPLLPTQRKRYTNTLRIDCIVLKPRLDALKEQ